MIDFEKYKERFETAQEQKESSNFRNKILEELKKAEWRERKANLDKSLQNIKEEKDFEKYQKDLAKLFDDIFEVITAPGVDAFVNWLNDLTDNKSEVNTKKLRKFLVDNYADYSEQIDSVIDNKNALDVPDNSLFAPLLAEVRKAVKKDCNAFLDRPDEFANKIDDFMKELGDDLAGLNDIEEPSYTKIEELYSDAQKSNSIDFYTDIITKIVEENQSLKAINDSERDESWLDKLKTRIGDTKKSIQALDDTDIATSDDDTIKKMFLKFDDEMFDAKKGVVDTLDNFIEKTWNEISDNYFKIKQYFENATKITANANDWDNFPKKAKLVALTDDYNSILNENPLVTILNLATKDVARTLNKSVKAIEKYENSEREVKQEIMDMFTNFTEEYETKIPLLESLSAINHSLSKKTQDIKDSIEGLKNGCKSLENKDVISYLNEDFTSDLNTYSNITTWFTEVLEQSGMKNELDWLNARLSEAKTGDISATDFDEKVLKELLNKGLISLTIKKIF
jgi:hypothetical protein